jgi:cobalamin synthase
VALVLLILIKMALLRTAIEMDVFWMALPAALILARLLAVIFRLMLPSVRIDGALLAAPLQIPQYWLMVFTLAILMASVLCLGYATTIGLIFLLATWVIFWHHLWQKFAGSFTESAMGALIEVSEVVVLIVVVLAA